ncbi:nitrate- and nitrite sensing domain-containing protein [Arcobacter acticola]|uniref:nitrate- and nitrite sensing domain-containing protein n=1 Tax=Arcobacter acticola TaxID=1849015 RepID=UPI001553BA4E|nr:nitrate- and nitrite sensing domain-containing protein [Arcobacter acticola]
MITTLKRLSIVNKMKLISGFPLIFIIILSLSVLFDSYEKKNKLESIKEIVVLNTKISLLLHETQKERGTSAGYLGSKGVKFKEDLLKQRTLTDARISEFNTFLATFPFQKYSSNNKKIMDKAVNDLLNIKDIRSKVDSLGIETKKAIEYYTNMNADFLIFVANTSLIADNSELVNNIKGTSKN